LSPVIFILIPLLSLGLALLKSKAEAKAREVSSTSKQYLEIVDVSPNLPEMAVVR
jgi:hypothetical protein